MFDKLFHEIEHTVDEPAQAIGQRRARLEPIIARARLLSDQLSNLQ